MSRKKTMLITGSSRGIGAETARLAAKSGYNVIINYNNSREKAEKLVSELRESGADVIAVKADISKAAEVKELFFKATERFGFVDVLVNNAAVSSFSLFTDISEELWDNTFDVNVKGAFLCAKEALIPMISKKEGSIINISSVWGICGSSCEVHYSAAKAAIIGFTKALAKEVGPSGINVNCIAPGVIDTDMNQSLSKEDLEKICDETPLGVIGKPSDIAEMVLYLASDKGKFITGQVISPNGGFLI